jgi:hypothetical protein
LSGSAIQLKDQQVQKPSGKGALYTQESERSTRSCLNHCIDHERNKEYLHQGCACSSQGLNYSNELPFLSEDLEKNPNEEKELLLVH